MSDDLKSLDELSTLTSGEDAIVEVAAPREPVRDSLGRSYATGKRKDAVARVWVKPGTGKVVVVAPPGMAQVPPGMMRGCSSSSDNKESLSSSSATRSCLWLHQG